MTNMAPSMGHHQQQPQLQPGAQQLQQQTQHQSVQRPSVGGGGTGHRPMNPNAPLLPSMQPTSVQSSLPSMTPIGSNASLNNHNKLPQQNPMTTTANNTSSSFPTSTMINMPPSDITKPGGIYISLLSLTFLVIDSVQGVVRTTGTVAE